MRRILLACGFLAGCSTVGPSTLYDPHFPATTESAGSFEVGRSRNAVVMVRAMRATSGNRAQHALGLIVARSDLNYPKIDHLRSYGTRLPYVRQDRHRIGYLRAEVGLIPLTAKQFDRLSKTGLAFRIYGPRGPYDASVPPEALELPEGRGNDR